MAWKRSSGSSDSDACRYTVRVGAPLVEHTSPCQHCLRCQVLTNKNQAGS